MKIVSTALDGVVIVEPDVFGDRRGTFSETFSERDFARLAAERGIPPVRYVQDNESRSRPGVVRGLHFQKSPHAQAKLVRAAWGRVRDVVVDMRGGSATFGRWIAVELSAENHRQIFIPRGFAHGFCVEGDGDAILQYKCDGFWAPESEAGVLWCDPALGIDWGIPLSRAIVSDKDAVLPTLADAYKFVETT